MSLLLGAVSTTYYFFSKWSSNMLHASPHSIQGVSGPAAGADSGMQYVLRKDLQICTSRLGVGVETAAPSKPIKADETFTHVAQLFPPL